MSHFRGRFERALERFSVIARRGAGAVMVAAVVVVTLWHRCHLAVFVVFPAFEDEEASADAEGHCNGDADANPDLGSCG